MGTTIGERVRVLRLRRGLTQARLAHLVGRSERWLIDFERGGVDPRLSDALALARVLGVGVEELAGHSTPGARRAGRPPPRPPVQRGARMSALTLRAGGRLRGGRRPAALPPHRRGRDRDACTERSST
ncbi:MAG TPA: helix-turn-helix transcriptional regulator [Candidatus Dormibacteraeota bacterium]|nr:helix-turn-helix transcriptional regulator [Candidatus Dormibacteraeota bacterium]